MKALLITTVAATLLACQGCRSHKESTVKEDKRLDRIELKRLNDSLAIESRLALTSAIEIDSPLIIVTRPPDGGGEISLIAIGGHRLRATVTGDGSTSVTVVGESRDSLMTSAHATSLSEVSSRDSRLPYLVAIVGASLLLTLTALSWRGKYPRR